MKKDNIAVLDDYQNAALECADADIAVFQHHFADPDAVIERLLPFNVVCAIVFSPMPDMIVMIASTP